jgi:CRISPR/Cas system CMR subunit Cmr4 (Cas7 group RAMP superfamily)
MNMENVVFSKFVGAGSKKYYLDAKKAKTGNLYLSIREVETKEEEGKDGAKAESRRVLVFDSAIKEFAAAFTEVVARIPAKERVKKEPEKAAF